MRPSRIPAELIAPVRLPVVARHLGQLWLVAAAMNAVPLLCSMASSEWNIAAALAGVTSVLTVSGFLSVRSDASPRLARNEALAIAALAFLSVSLLMSIPFVAAGLTPVNAAFESVSAITTTGLSTVSNAKAKPFAFHLTRSWMQWYGGLGFVVISLAITNGSRTASRRLAAEEIESDELAGGTLGYARRILAVYVGLTLIGGAALVLAGALVPDAILHVLAGVSTGGFSPYDNSLAGMRNMPAAAVTIGICVAAAFPLTVYFPVIEEAASEHDSGAGRQTEPRSPRQRGILIWRFLTGLLRRVCGDRQVQGILLCGLLTSLCLGLLWSSSSGLGVPESGSGTGASRVEHGLLNAFSAQTTAGFSTIDHGSLDPASKLVLIFSMLIGGGSGSTAGGFKMLRLLILLQLLRTLILRTAIPRQAVYEPSIGNRPLEQRDREAALLTILLYVLIVVLSWVPFVVSGYPAIDALFEVTSATGTVGLSTGIVSEHLSPALKLLLCADMLLGRLEVLALLVLVSPYTWSGWRAASQRARESLHTGRS